MFLQKDGTAIKKKKKMISLMKKIKVNFIKQEINHTLKIIYENMNN